MLKRLLPVLLILLGFPVSRLAGVAVLPEQPVFVVRIHMLGRAGHVLVNGIPVFRNYKGLPVILDVPVNEYMLNGLNTFGFSLFDDPDDKIPPDAVASATLVLRQNGTPKGEGTEIGTVALSGHFAAGAAAKFPPVTAEAGRMGPAVIERVPNGLLNLSRTFESAVRLPQWAWSRSAQIASTTELRNELEAAYRRLWSALEQKNRDALRPLFLEKAPELAQAYYLSVADALSVIELPDKPFEPGWSLDTPRWDEAVMELGASGRLARLTYRGAAPVIVYHDEDRLVHAFDMWWRHDRGQWILTR